MLAAAVVAALGLVLGPAPAAVPTRAAAPNMALLDFLNSPGELFKSSVTIDTRSTGAAPETLAGKTVGIKKGDFDPAFKYDRRGIKTPPKKVLGNTFPASLMPGAAKGSKQTG